MNSSRRKYIQGILLGATSGLAGCHEEDEEGTDTRTPGAATATNTPAPTDQDKSTATDEESPTGEAVTTPQRWHSFQYNDNNGGVAPGAPSFENPTVEWRAELSGSATLQPGVDASGIYVPTRSALEAFERETGELRWQFGDGNSAPATPVVAEDFLYVVTNQRAAKIHLEDGWSAWEFNFTSELDNVLSVSGKSPPQLAEDKLFVNIVVNQSSGEYSTVNYCLALDGGSGQLLWSYRPEQQTTSPNTAYTGAPVVDVDNVYFIAGHKGRSAGLYALDRNTGSLRWTSSFDGNGWSTPSIADGNIYFSDALAHSFDTDGSNRYSRTFESRLQTPGVAVTGPHHVLGTKQTEESQGAVTAVSTNSGALIWTMQQDADFFTPTIADETVFIGDSTGTIYRISIDSGDVRSKYQLDGLSEVALSAPIIYEKNICISVRDIEAQKSYIYTIE